MITISADFHLNAQNRLEDFSYSLEQIAKYANESSLLILLGDIYHHRKPTPKEMNVFRDFINKVKVPIEMIIGNHDQDREDSALDEFSKFNHPNISLRKAPYILSTHGLSLWLYHGTIEGAQIGPYNMTLGLKEELKVKELKKLGCDFYLCGHIHKAQIITDNIIYPGSIERVDFGERNEKKYVVQLDETTKKFGFKQLDIRPMVQMEIEVKTNSGVGIIKTERAPIVKIVFKGTRKELDKFSDTEWRKYLSEVAYSFQIMYEEIQEERKVSSGINEKVSLDSSFKEYAKIKQLDEVTINRGLELLSEY